MHAKLVAEKHGREREVVFSSRSLLLAGSLSPPSPQLEVVCISILYETRFVSA